MNITEQQQHTVIIYTEPMDYETAERVTEWQRITDRCDEYKMVMGFNKRGELFTRPHAKSGTDA